MTFAPEELTRDGFLNGRLSILQPKKGYRAATDPVLLAAGVNAKSGESVLELGCGVGVASLCLGWRISGLSLSGVEVQPDYAELAQRNASHNAIQMQVITADIADFPEEIRQISYDHVIANPPFLLAGSGTAAGNKSKETAFREDLPLAGWIDAGIKRVKPKGHFTMIHLAERLPHILNCFGDRLGDVEVKPFASRAGRIAGRVLVRARKGGRGAFRLHPPLLLHCGESHKKDGDDFSEIARNILRYGAQLDF